MVTPGIDGRITVAVLMGGASGEHDVSLSSGRGILANLREDRYLPLPVTIGRDGAWTIEGVGTGLPLWEGLGVVAARAQVVFPALHGPNGEDGTMQGLLQLAGLPYVGSDHYASALAMDKPRAKDVYRCAGLSTPDQVEITRFSRAAGGDLLEETVRRLGLPCVVKTPRLGSSVGVDIARDRAGLARILGEILPIAGGVMIERFVTGTELTAPVLEDPDTGAPVALPLIEIRPKTSGWFDYDAKYRMGGADELCPAPISDELTRQVQEIGLAAHRALDCRGMSRTDVIVGEDGTPWVIETNTIPGFTPTSLLPQAAAAAGIDYPALVDRLIRRALAT